MRRKIEKFLAQKAGVDESQIVPSDDGRYDFKGDFEGVLNAVRGKDTGSGTRGRLSVSSRSSMGSAGSSQASPKKSQAAPRAGNAPHVYYPYPPYSGFYAHPPQHPHMFGKENVGNYAHPPPYWNPMGMPFPIDPSLAPATPSLKSLDDSPIDKAGDFASSFLLSAKKSIFDSPGKNLHPELEIGSARQERMEIQGMTPPLSDLKNTFATPMPNHLESSDLSREETASLNKSLFSEAVLKTPAFSSTPFASTVHPILINIGVDLVKENTEMKLNSRVSISPINMDASSIRYFDNDNESDEAMKTSSNDQSIMPPPFAPRMISNTPAMSSSVRKLERFVDLAKTPRVKHVKSDASSIYNPTPFDSTKMVKHLTTPSTAATAEQSSFWSDGGIMSPVPLSPFGSSPRLMMMMMEETSSSSANLFPSTAEKTKIDDDETNKSTITSSAKRRRIIKAAPLEEQ
jgi:hypothetical protein